MSVYTIPVVTTIGCGFVGGGSIWCKNIKTWF